MCVCVCVCVCVSCSKRLIHFKDKSGNRNCEYSYILAPRLETVSGCEFLPTPPNGMLLGSNTGLSLSQEQQVTMALEIKKLKSALLLTYFLLPLWLRVLLLCSSSPLLYSVFCLTIHFLFLYPHVFLMFYHCLFLSASLILLSIISTRLNLLI
jgi:hypothetical protein